MIQLLSKITLKLGVFLFLCRYEKDGRLTVTDHRRNFSRTYEPSTDVIANTLTTDFKPDDNLYIGGLPTGAMVRLKLMV